MPHCNANNFQAFLDELSKKYEHVYNILTLDNGAFHKAKSLIIPENIGLLFLPAYSPELNPAENMWAILKRKFTNKLHHTLEEVSEFITKATANITKEDIKKLVGLNIFSQKQFGLINIYNWYYSSAKPLLIHFSAVTK
jgi:transposase